MTWSSAFKWLGRAWAVIFGLARLALAFILLGAFHSAFERVVVALLVIIYASVDAFGIWNHMLAIQQSKLERNRFLELMEQLGSTKYQGEDSRDLIREENETIERGLVKIYIRGTFTFLLYAMAVLTLLGAMSEL